MWGCRQRARHSRARRAACDGAGADGIHGWWPRLHHHLCTDGECQPFSWLGADEHHHVPVLRGCRPHSPAGVRLWRPHDPVPPVRRLLLHRPCDLGQAGSLCPRGSRDIPVLRRARSKDVASWVDSASNPGKTSHLSLPYLFYSIYWYAGLEDSSMAIVAACEILRKLVYACSCMYRWSCRPASPLSWGWWDRWCMWCGSVATKGMEGCTHQDLAVPES